MATMTGTSTSRLRATDGSATGCVMDLEVEVDVATGRKRALSVVIRPSGRRTSVTEEAIRAALATFAVALDEVGHGLIDRAAVLAALADGSEVELADAAHPNRADLTVTSATGVVMAIEVKTGRSRLTEADYAQIAEIYMAASQRKVSVLEAVAASRQVSRSQAGWLIQRTREKGFLPPAKGRGRQML